MSAAISPVSCFKGLYEKIRLSFKATLAIKRAIQRPQETVSALAGFLGTSLDAEQAGREVVPPSSIGRWRKHNAYEIRSLITLGRPALEHFGY